jgi:NAD(P)-dependent dehydrogenase (short-subunit alcohol dehydrogenase family)
MAEAVMRMGGDPLFSVAGRSIVLTGAASGLGAAMARALAARSARLTLVDVSAPPLNALATELGARAHVADITDAAAVTALMEGAVAAYGALDALVNSAGLLRIAPAHDLDIDAFRASMDVNVTGAFLLSRAAAKAMATRGGRIVHFASVSSQVANRNYAAYATSKAALSQMVRVLAREWAGDGITVNAIGPAMTETGMTGSYLSDAEFRTQALSVIPLGRFGSPDDLLGPLLLLLAPAGSFITGQTVFVDGGRTLV